jgi:uncharacterized protein YndB with AHSA1/START domain
MTRHASRELAPIVREVVVRCPVERAFRVWTEGIGSWWPFASHSIGEARTETVIMECRVGGRFYERMAGGAEAEWGTVLEWDPPARLLLEWRVNPENPPTEVEVRFTALEPGTTRVTLTHRGWERFAGPRGVEVWSSYGAVDGWSSVLGCFVPVAQGGD